MSKKIVIVPVFCESHLIKYQIPNIIDTIDPDYIIYNEGMFPVGPESNTIVDKYFLDEFTLDGGGKRGFDYPELEKIIEEAQNKYPNTKIILNKMDYKSKSASENYVHACSNFKELGIDIEVGDYIFPYEGDVFHHEDSKSEIQEYLNQIKPNEGFKSKWIDFVENQYYAEKSSLKPWIWKEGKESLVYNSNPDWENQGRSRKICIRFGDIEIYKSIILNFESQKYETLYPTDLTTFHYPWWRSGKYKELRKKQLNRHLNYWSDFEKGVGKAKEPYYLDIDVRPSMGPQALESTYRFIRFIDIEHPIHIKSHSCYIEELDINQKNKIKQSKKQYIQ